jgi:hypothetical protein
MAIETTGAVLKEIKRLFGEGVISGLSDAQLLTQRRFSRRLNLPN